MPQSKNEKRMGTTSVSGELTWAEGNSSTHSKDKNLPTIGLYIPTTEERTISGKTKGVSRDLRERKSFVVLHSWVLQAPSICSWFCSVALSPKGRYKKRAVDASGKIAGLATSYHFKSAILGAKGDNGRIYNCASYSSASYSTRCKNRSPIYAQNIEQHPQNNRLPRW